MPRGAYIPHSPALRGFGLPVDRGIGARGSGAGRCTGGAGGANPIGTFPETGAGTAGAFGISEGSGDCSTSPALSSAAESSAWRIHSFSEIPSRAAAARQGASWPSRGRTLICARSLAMWSHLSVGGTTLSPEPDEVVPPFARGGPTFPEARTPGFPVYPGLRQARSRRARAPPQRPSYPATQRPELPSDHSSQLPDRSDPATRLPSYPAP